MSMGGCSGVGSPYIVQLKCCAAARITFLFLQSRPLANPPIFLLCPASPTPLLQSASGRMSFQAPIGAAVRDIVVDSLIVKVGGCGLWRPVSLIHVCILCLMCWLCMCGHVAVWQSRCPVPSSPTHCLPASPPPILPIAQPASQPPPRPPACSLPPCLLQVVLPEGASDPKVDTPLRLLGGGASLSTEYTYLDVMGRPVVVLRLANVVPEMNSLLTVGGRCGGWGVNGRCGWEGLVL